MGKVVHISTADTQGGAARAAFRIHTGLQKIGWDSRMLVGSQSEAGRSDIDSIPHQDRRWKHWGVRLLQQVEQKTGLEYLLLPWKRKFLTHRFLTESSIVHLHNLHGGYFSVDSLPAISQGRSVIWSVHDLWPLTGHCYYPDMNDCQRWKSGCGQCPGLRQEGHYPLSIDTTRFLWKRKARFYAKTKIVFVGGSRWTVDRILESPLAHHSEVHLIPYGLDVDLFHPMDKQTARAVLGIPKNKKVLYFSAVSLTSARKGWSYIKAAIEKHLGDVDLTLLVAGDNPPDVMNRPNFQIIRLGALTNDRLNVLAYNAADLFVGASLSECFGQVFSEAMACGTPCVGFDTSGVRDVIRHEKTGYLAQLKDADDLGRGIRLLLTQDERRQTMGVESRRVAAEEYSVELQVQRFASLYQSLLDSKTPSVDLATYVGHS